MNCKVVQSQMQVQAGFIITSADLSSHTLYGYVPEDEDSHN